VGGRKSGLGARQREISQGAPRTSTRRGGTAAGQQRLEAKARAPTEELIGGRSSAEADRRGSAEASRGGKEHTRPGGGGAEVRWGGRHSHRGSRQQSERGGEREGGKTLARARAQARDERGGPAGSVAIQRGEIRGGTRTAAGRRISASAQGQRAGRRRPPGHEGSENGPRRHAERTAGALRRAGALEVGGRGG